MKQTKAIDPIAYIESAFIDRPKKTGDKPTDSTEPSPRPRAERGKKPRFRKTEMSAPRPRRTRDSLVHNAVEPELKAVWEALPKHIEFLVSYYDDGVTSNYYGGFGESRNELIKRLLDPELSLEEAARLLGVCPATIRRYTNRGWLAHHRTRGGQRRFRLSDVIRFVEEHGRTPEA